MRGVNNARLKPAALRDPDSELGTRDSSGARIHPQTHPNYTEASSSPRGAFFLFLENK